MDMLRSLGIKIDIFGNQSGLKQIDSGMSGLISKANALTGVLAGAFAFNQFKGFITENIRFGDTLADQAMRLGISVEQLQEWSFVAEKAGASTETMTKTIQFLNKNLGDAQSGSKSATQALLKFGLTREQIKNTNNASDILLILADRLEAMPTAARRVGALAAVGGKGAKDLALVLGQGSKALREQIELLQKQGGILSGEAAKAADEYSDRMLVVSKSWQVAKTNLVLTLLPALEKLTDVMVFGISKLKEFDKATGLGKVGILSFGAAVVAAGLASLAAFLPQIIVVGVITAAFSAMYLVVDDLFHFFKGDALTATEDLLNSLLGFEMAQKVILLVRDAFKSLTSYITGEAFDGLDQWRGLWDRIAAAIGLVADGLKLVKGFLTGNILGGAKEFLGGALGNLSTIFEPTFTRVTTPQASLKGATAKELFNMDPSAFMPQKAGIGSAIGSIKDAVLSAIDPSIKRELLLPNAQNLIDYSEVPGAKFNNSNATNNITINVNGGNPLEVETAIRKALDSELTFAKQNFITAKP